MAGLSTRLSVWMTVATSPSGVSRPYWAAITWCPSAWRGAITLLKHEPSAQRPWQKTMLGLLCADMDRSFREIRRSRGVQEARAPTLFTAAGTDIAGRLTCPPPARIAGSCGLLVALAQRRLR